jgi:1L-myo-inositol 1-phosphate cytidylyltransferase / CDP-L-myo-inositol myo-inositolphosphotransferase
MAHTQVRPNHITLIGTLVGVCAAALLAVGTYWCGILGSLLFVCAVVIDGCDGEVARLTFQDSPFGQKFDVVTDNFVHVAIFLGIGIGVYHRNPAGPYVLLLALLLGGFALNLALTYFFLVRRPGFARRSVPPTSLKGRMRELLLRGFEAAMNRDFAYLILVFALADRLEWFLWGTAIGSYVFAILLVLIYRWGEYGDGIAHE